MTGTDVIKLTANQLVGTDLLQAVPLVLSAALKWLATRTLPRWLFVPPAHRQFGWWLMGLAVLPALGAFIQFRRARTTINPHHPERSAALVTRGVYAWTRNPMYLSLWLVLIGWAVRLGSLGALLCALPFAPLLTRVQIRAEEQALGRHFTGEYERYCRHVHRWFGRRIRPGAAR